MHNHPFHNIGIICDYVHPETPTFMPELIAYLKQHDRKVFITPTTKALLPALEAKEILPEDLSEHCDVLIVVGGDGSLLRASMIALDNDLPIMGINRGHLGFLTALPANALANLHAILDGEYIEEQRIILEGTILDNGNVLHRMRALNDIVLSHSKATHMLEFDISTQSKRISHLRADGYIVATPTGSTAYALSAGGPILEPQLHALALVPMFPHSLSSRPLVVNADHTIDIHLNDNQTSAMISADGQVQYHFDEEMHCQINTLAKPLRLIHAADYDYFTNLSDKLSWHNSTKRN